jgi:hypothetical protein
MALEAGFACGRYEKIYNKTYDNIYKDQNEGSKRKLKLMPPNKRKNKAINAYLE